MTGSNSKPCPEQADPTTTRPRRSTTRGGVHRRGVEAGLGSSGSGSTLGKRSRTHPDTRPIDAHPPPLRRSIDRRHACSPAIVELDDLITRGPRHVLACTTRCTGLKAGVHHGGPSVDPNVAGEPDPASIARVSEWVRERFPNVDPEPLDPQTCLYTSTVDGSSRRRAAWLGRRRVSLLGARLQVRPGHRPPARSARPRLRHHRGGQGRSPRLVATSVEGKGAP